MAITTKLPPQQARPQPQRFSALPTEDVSAASDLSDFKWLIHSLSGIGKTSFIRSMPDSVHIDSERGTLAHSGRIIRLENWTHFVKVVNELLSTKHPYKIVGIDTIDGLYNMAWDYMLAKLTITHPSEAAHGKGWERITSTLFEQLNKLQLSGLGIVCTAHTNSNQARVRGIELTVFQPSMVGGSPRSAYQRTIDFFDEIGFLRMASLVKAEKDVRKVSTGQIIETEVRFLDFSPSQHWVTKDRSGRLDTPIELPNNWRQDWARLEEVWAQDAGVQEEVEATANPSE